MLRALEQATKGMEKFKAAVAQPLNVSGWTASLNQVVQMMQRISHQARKSVSEMRQLVRTVAQLNRESGRANAAKAAGPASPALGPGLMMLGTSLAGAGLVGALGSAVHEYSDFNLALTESQAIMKVSEEQNQRMINQTFDLAGATKFSAESLAASYYFLASAGLDTEKSIGALPVVARFAQAGMIDMEKATSMLANAQAALGMRAEDATQNMRNMVRISDVLVRANQIADGTTKQFAVALAADAAPSLRAFNKTVEEGVAILAVYADAGIKNEVAGGHLGRVLRFLSQKAIEHADAHKRLGIAVFDAGGQMRPVADIIENMEHRFAGMSDKTRAASLAALGYEARIQRAILPLVGMSGKLREYQHELEKAGGTTQTVADKQMLAFANQMKSMWATVKVFAITIGEEFAPALKDVADIVKVMVGVWRRVPGPIRTVAVAIVAVTAAMLALAGAAIVAGVIINTFFGGIGLIVGAVVTLGAAFYGFLGGVTVGLGIVTGFFSYVRQQLVAFWQWLEPARKAFTDLLNTVWFTTVQTFKSIKGVVVSTWNQMTGSMSVDWNMVMTYLVGGIKLVEFSIINLGRVMEFMWAAGQAGLVIFANSVLDFFTVLLPYAINYVRLNFMGLMSIIMSLSKVVLTNLVMNFAALVKSIFGYLVDLTKSLGVMFNTLFFDLAKAVIQIFKKLPEIIRGKVRLEDIVADVGSKVDFKLPEFDTKNLRELTRGFRGAYLDAFDLPPTEMTLFEKNMRGMVKGLGGGLESDFMTFLARGMKGMVSPETLAEAMQAGQEIGRNFNEGSNREIKKFDAALFRSVEALARYVEYRDRIMNPQDQPDRGGKGKNKIQLPRFDAANVNSPAARDRSYEQIELLKQIVQNTKKAADGPKIELKEAKL